MLAGNPATVAEAALTKGGGGLDAFRLALLKPVQPMLAQTAPDTAAALAALGDARLLAGRRLDGRQRLARHLWRMGVAMLIATMSFFLGQADEFPAWLRHGVTTAGPPLLVLGTVLVHYVRVRWVRPARRQPAIA